MKILISLISLFCLFQQVLAQSYQVGYQLNYTPDSTNLRRVATEEFLLFIKVEGASFYASENFLKKDSISTLVKNGVLSENDIIGNSSNRFKTKFPQFIQKDYSKKSAKLYENIGFFNYTFSVQNELKWEITAKRDTLAGYLCTKATTNYAGRSYEAWFTPEIPISDGPYVFWGLPGLVVKLADTRNHYVFTLKQFRKYAGKITEIPTYRKQQPIETNRTKVFSLREEYRKDLPGHLKRTTGRSLVTLGQPGSSTPLPLADRSWDNNPLELK